MLGPSPAFWDTSCPDWYERLIAGRSLVPDLPLFEAEASRALRVFKRLRMPDVFGTPTMGDAAGPWLFPIVAAIFGSYDAELHRRMIQEYFLLIAKKNSKTSSAAAIMLTALIVNYRPDAEFALIAPTKDVADRSFKQCAGAIRIDPELTKLFQIQHHIRTITHRKNGAKLQVKAADTDVVTGIKATGALIDETHVFAIKPAAAEVFLEIRGALAARPDGFLIQITTQSKHAPAGVFRSELHNARDVRDGKLIIPLLPVLYELPLEASKDGGWKERRFWPLINPNLGRSVDEAFLERELMKAEREGPAALALFASQHFNVEVGLALQSNSWAGAEFWRGNEKTGASNIDPGLTLDAIILRCEVIVVGIDGGGLDDLLGLSVMGREAVTGRWLLWNHAWAHEIVKERRKEIAPVLDDLAHLGQLTFVRNPGDDVEAVADIVMQIQEAGLLAEKDAVGVDTYGVVDIVKALTREDRGIPADCIVGIPQGWQLNGAIKTAERNLAGGNLRHAGLELMDFCVGNARVEPRGNALTITKQAAGSAKIDPLIATFNAIVLMGKNPVAGGGSYMDDEELMVI